MVNYIDVKDSNSAEEFKNVRDNGQWFVWFHATWCGHCRAMDEEWEKLVKTNNTSVKLARVESEFIDKNKDTNILGYPTLRLFTNSKLTDYNSGRDLESFQNFLKENEVKTVARPSQRRRRPPSQRRRRPPSSRRRRPPSQRRKTIFTKKNKKSLTKKKKTTFTKKIILKSFYNFTYTYF